ncbi:MAG: twin-arginine translocase TatA/TatE family subunit [Chloroflexota bacterium]|nr:twin-arginine translocase TatA/TatE family subunit [Chloroflexota bacterium]
MPSHWWELAVIVALGLLVFGPKRLPEMGSSIGKTIREFQKSMREATNPAPPVAPPSATQTAAQLPAAPAEAMAAEPTAAVDEAPRVEEDAIH